VRTARQLRDYIRDLESAAFALRSEVMLRNSPHADAKIRVFDQVIEDGRKAHLEALARKEQKRAQKGGE
jgi:hypothetical protein